MNQWLKSNMVWNSKRLVVWPFFGRSRRAPVALETWCLSPVAGGSSATGWSVDWLQLVQLGACRHCVLNLEDDTIAVLWLNQHGVFCPKCTSKMGIRLGIFVSYWALLEKLGLRWPRTTPQRHTSPRFAGSFPSEGTRCSTWSLQSWS